LALKDYMESEVMVAVAATAAALSPRARKVARRGAVYGLAGVLTISDAISAAVRDTKTATATAGLDAGTQDTTDATGMEASKPAEGGSA
jgi:hypothetical protein